MKSIKSLLFTILSIFIIISCSQFGDSLRLPGENPKDIIFYELDNDYLAPESKEFIESNYPSNQVNLSYVLVGKKTYGFEADLDNEKSLSFDEDGAFRLDREHPFIKDKYKEGRIGESDRDKDRDEKDDEGRDKDKDRDKEGEGKERDKCFEFVMPFTFIMPDGSTITIEDERDMKKVEEWYKNNPEVEDRPEIQFPVDIVIINEEGEEETVTVNDEEELKEVRAECEKVYREDDRCFDIVMPFTFTMPDGSSITIEKEEDHEKIEEWYKNNPDSKERPDLVFPVDIILEDKTKEGEEETKVITINNEEEMIRVMMKCRDKDKKDRCKKLHGDEIPDCIREYVSSNYPDDKIVHSRMLKTKDNHTLYIVKLDKNGILKFNGDCELLD